MKISKSLIKTIAVAVAVGSAAYCIKKNNSNTNNSATEKNVIERKPGDCPACGLG